MVHCKFPTKLEIHINKGGFVAYETGDPRMALSLAHVRTLYYALGLAYFSMHHGQDSMPLAIEEEGRLPSAS